VFTAYYDESGSPDAQAVVVAGFVASDDQWKEFERNWNESLQKFGISYFHEVEFAQSVGDLYCDLSVSDKLAQSMRRPTEIYRQLLWPAF